MVARMARGLGHRFDDVGSVSDQWLRPHIASVDVLVDWDNLEQSFTGRNIADVAYEPPRTCRCHVRPAIPSGP